MASSLSSYLAGAMTDATLRGVDFIAPANVYVALFTAAPGPGSGGPEATYPGYARQMATFDAADATGKAMNNTKIEFPANTGSTTQSVTHLAIFDAATGGNKLYLGPLTTPKAIEAGDYVAFAVGTLSSTLEVAP